MPTLPHHRREMPFLFQGSPLDDTTEGVRQCYRDQAAREAARRAAPPRLAPPPRARPEVSAARPAATPTVVPEARRPRNPARPLHVACKDCGASVPVRPKGKLSERCETHARAHKAAYVRAYQHEQLAAAGLARAARNRSAAA